MKIETLEVAGIGPAVRAMRNSFSSWDKSDTKHGMIGPKDMALSDRLARAGGSHSKHLRLIQVWAEIEAPLYWWKHFDCYRLGVEKVSTSTMHTITARPFTTEMFTGNVHPEILEKLNLWRGFWEAVETKERKQLYWRTIIENLPSGFIQRRTVLMSYQAIRHMVEDRRGHKLGEWAEFIAWTETLPESWMITGNVPEARAYDELNDD